MYDNQRQFSYRNALTFCPFALNGHISAVPEPVQLSTFALVASNHHEKCAESEAHYWPLRLYFHSEQNTPKARSLFSQFFHSILPRRHPLEKSLFGAGTWYGPCSVQAQNKTRRLFLFLPGLRDNSPFLNLRGT